MTASPFDAALSVASHARALGFRRIAVRQSKGSRSCYVWFKHGSLQLIIRCSDHAPSKCTYHYNLVDLTDVAPAVAFMRGIKSGRVAA